MVFILLWFILLSSFCFEILVFLLLCSTMTSISKGVVLCLCPISKGSALFFCLFPHFLKESQSLCLYYLNVEFLFWKQPSWCIQYQKKISSIKINAIRAVGLDVSSDSVLFLLLWKQHNLHIWMHRRVTVLHRFMCQYLTWFGFFLHFCVLLMSEQQSLQVSNRLHINPLRRRGRLEVVGFFTKYTGY